MNIFSIKPKCILYFAILVYVSISMTIKNRRKQHSKERFSANSSIGVGVETHWGFKNTKYQNISECGCTRKFIWPPKESAIALNSSCSDPGTFYESNQNVVSFTLHIPYRKDHKRIKLYKEGIEINLQRMREFYPGFTMRLYTDAPLKSEYCDLICNNPDLFWCDIRKTPSLGDQSKMFFACWRFLSLGDPTVDVFLSRDLDSAITFREVAVVRDWLMAKEKKAFHVMRDLEEYHDVPILAGLWGARNYLVDDAVRLQEQIVDMSKTRENYKMLDQDILREAIFYPRKLDIVAYDSHHCEKWNKITETKPFPTKRDKMDYVGNRDLGREKYMGLPKCPKECRPSYGRHWEYC